MQHIFTVDEINRRMQSDPGAFVWDCEAAFHAQVASLADAVANRPGMQLVMLAGPSSSGKTTTAALMTALFKRRGRQAEVISLDDFYLEQLDGLRFEDGTPDYETVHSLDIEGIVSCINTLVRDGFCFLPQFSFLTKKRESKDRDLSVSHDAVLIVEGLHALNPLITDAIDCAAMTKVYVSVSTRIYAQDAVVLTKRDLRFIRRMVRDDQFRASPVNYTFYLWNGVRKGEDRYLFPFSSRADVRIDSIHPYEPCVFKPAALSLLRQIKPDSAYYDSAAALEQKLMHFESADVSYVPKNSLLREFLG